MKNVSASILDTNILLRATYHRAPKYGGVRTWVEGLLACGHHALAGASNLLGYKEYTPYLLLILVEN